MLLLKVCSAFGRLHLCPLENVPGFKEEFLWYFWRGVLMFLEVLEHSTYHIKEEKEFSIPSQ